jgi:hypothetical protein
MTMTAINTRVRRSAATTVIACICAVTLVACGGSSKHGSASASNNYQSFLSFSKCMRANGVPNFPDPSAGGGISITPSDGVNPGAPAMKAAMKTCSHLLPGGGPGNQKPSEQTKLHLLALAKCMRAHGQQNFPDPTTTPPATPGQGQPGEVLGVGGLFLNLSAAGLNPSSPAFQQAAEACHFPGAGRLASGPGGANKGSAG